MYKEAIYYYNQALELFVQNGNQIFEIMLLVALLSTFVFMKDSEKKKEYFEKITTKFNSHSTDEFFKTNYLFAKALLLKESTRLADRVEAQKIFKEISNLKEIYTYVSKESLLFYLELLLEELKYSPNDSLMNEIEQVSEKLKYLAKNQGSIVLIVESMLIEAKINIIKLNFDRARHLLTQSQITAEEKGLKKLSQKISMEHDSFLMKMNQLEDIIDQSASFQERLELANFEDLLNNMIRKSYNEPSEEHEKGLILLIVSPAGLSMFSRQFTIEKQMVDQIFASLLTAINSFSQETFKTDETLERIKLGGNTVIIKSISDFSVCYAFKGPSYHATKKMNQFISKIQNNQRNMTKLNEFDSYLPQDVIQDLNILVDEIFTN